jgi:hypothetical protein
MYLIYFLQLQPHQLMLRLDGNYMVAVVPQILAELHTLLGECILAIGTSDVLIDQPAVPTVKRKYVKITPI